MNVLAPDYEALTWQNDALDWFAKFFYRQALDHYSRRFATVRAENGAPNGGSLRLQIYVGMPARARNVATCRASD